MSDINIRATTKTVFIGLDGHVFDTELAAAQSIVAKRLADIADEYTTYDEFDAKGFAWALTQRCDDLLRWFTLLAEVKARETQKADEQPG